MTLPKPIKNIRVEDTANHIERIYIQGDRIIVHYDSAANIATADDIGDDTSNHWVRIGATQTIIMVHTEGKNVIAKVHLSATAFELIIVPTMTNEPIEEYDYTS